MSCGEPAAFSVTQCTEKNSGSYTAVFFDLIFTTTGDLYYNIINCKIVFFALYYKGTKEKEPDRMRMVKSKLISAFAFCVLLCGCGQETLQGEVPSAPAGSLGALLIQTRAPEATEPYAAVSGAHPTPVCTPGASFNALVNASGNTIKTRFLVPEGFERVPVKEGSFAEYLRNLPLKADGSRLHYIGKKGKLAGEVPKDVYSAPAAHAAVLDLPMLGAYEQCADTVIHLYAEYLYAQKRYSEISFIFNNGFECDFLHYTRGYRPDANCREWVRNEDNWTGTDRRMLNLYLEKVFLYANTASLFRYDLQAVRLSDMAIGDMFIVPASAGDSGHVVIIADMIRNPKTGEVRFITVQGSMPAVEAHVMMNAEEAAFSPWQNARFENGMFVSATYWECPVENLRRFR